MNFFEGKVTEEAFVGKGFSVPLEEEEKAILKAYAGKENVKVAFKYVSTSAVAPTWEIKTVIIK